VLHTERRRRAGRREWHGASRTPAQMGGAHPSLCRCGYDSEAQSPGADVAQLGSGDCLPCATHGIRPPTWRSRAHRRRRTRPVAATSPGVRRRSGRSVGVAVGLRRRRCRGCGHVGGLAQGTERVSTCALWTCLREWGSPLPHLHRDRAHPLPHLRRDCDEPTGLGMNALALGRDPTIGKSELMVCTPGTPGTPGTHRTQGTHGMYSGYSHGMYSGHAWYVLRVLSPINGATGHGPSVARQKGWGPSRRRGAVQAGRRSAAARKRRSTLPQARIRSRGRHRQRLRLQ
jgi:hypothetical protein